MANKDRLIYRLPDTETLVIKLVGEWDLSEGLVSTDDFAQQLSFNPALKAVVVDGRQLKHWDSSLICYLRSVVSTVAANNLSLEYLHTPEGVLRLIKLADAVPESISNVEVKPGFSLTESVGKRAIHFYQEMSHFTGFVGESVIAFVNFYRGKAVYRRVDFFGFIEDSGPSSLAIVTLISLLIGMILAFVGAVQLEKFGASIYVASLVGLSMAREMAAMMTAIIMAGRTGAAFAAQLGSMQVNEEIDALKTMGVSPVEFLVVPRMLALVIMLPLLTIYANVMGILGGALVSKLMLDITWSMYIDQMMSTVPLIHFVIGLIKSVLFGVVIALSGCFMGMSSGRSASAVGKATTNAVVLGIVLIIVFDSLVTIATTVIGV
ncbi:MAG: ABC transporter permease [Hahellaceae bacterium]|jgi:phospholipid/cholesterol/gamma-HCH transport system permease protein|nr:ABC transporter permease [Hahellaceae bacterium]MCP5212452.1 ABC transporter permease [Hahellaceae bacterium]